MLSSNITIYDVAFFLTVCCMFMGSYILYHLGYRNGYMDGAKARRKAKRKLRGDAHANARRGYLGMGQRN